jgi:nicotinamide-nucleotide amidase
MEGYFKDRHPNSKITENNYQQVYLPEGCVPFQNTCGTAPGCGFEAEGKYIIMIPGPPRECRTMFRLSAVPYLKKLSDCTLLSHNIHVFGMGESVMESKLHDLMMELTNPTLAPYAKEGECFLRVTAKGENEDECEALMAPVIEKAKAVLGDTVYSIDIETLEETVFTLLKEQSKTLATAESCTGGLVAKRITDIPGASAVFRGGAVTYATDTKTEILGVDDELLAEKGAVCRDVAIQMALGVRARFGADVGIGITGVAGPSSDDFGNEVGTVFVAMSVSSGTFCRELHAGKDRDRVRTTAANNAFDMIRRYLTGLSVE